MPAEGVGETVDQVEAETHVQRVADGLIRDAGGPDRRNVRGTDLVGSERHLLEQIQRGSDLRLERRGTPILQDLAGDLRSVRFRRDRAVGLRSKGALIEP